MPTPTPEVLEREVPAAAIATSGDVQVASASGIDIQIATARKYPRSITTFVRTATELATFTPETAAACLYALPRGGKPIEGPSVRLAEICAQAWGNLRIQARVVDHDARFVTARGEAWDVEKNVAIGFEVRRRITNSKGETYSDDMIVVTGNAAASIALRNAIFKIIPTPIWKPMYDKVRQVIAGNVETFAARRDEMLKMFAVMGVTEARLLAALELKGKADLTLDHMVVLAGLYTALKDGDTTLEEAFPEGGGLGSVAPSAPRKATNTMGINPPPQTAKPDFNPPGQGETRTPASPSPTGRVVSVLDHPSGGTLITLSTGFKAATRDPDLARAAKQVVGRDVDVELKTRPPRDPRWHHQLVDIVPVAVREPGAEG